MCTLFHFGQAFEIEIAARGYTDNSAAPNRLTKVLQGIDRKRASRFENDPFNIEHLEDGRAQPVFLDGQRIGQPHPLEPLKRTLSDLPHRRTVSKSVHAIKANRLSRLEGRLQTRSAGGFDKCVLAGSAKIFQHTCGQTAAANGYDQMIGNLAKLVYHFNRNAGLSLDHILIVKRRQKMAPRFRAECLG